MANHKPLKLDQNEIQRFQAGDTIGIDSGGTGSTTAAGARSALGLEIGSDVQGYSVQLDVLSGWSSSGFLVGDGAGGFLPRQIATAAASRITIQNGDGVAGNVVIDLATVGAGASSGLYKFAYDTYGRVTAHTAVTTGDLTPLLNSTYAALSGATYSGFVTLHADPTSPLHAVTKQYVDNLFSSGGIPPFAAVVAKTTGNIDINAPGATHDGVTLINGDRLLVALQSDQTENGIYVFNGGSNALTRASDADESSEFTPARQVFVQNGNTFSNTGWAVGNSSQPTIGTDPITFTQVSGAASYTAGNGLLLTGNQFSAVGVVGEITVTGAGIGLENSGVVPGTYTKVTVDEKGRVIEATQALPADIGAQPYDETLAALAQFNSNGFIVQTSTDTFVSRSIVGTAGRVQVTNGDGATGDVTVDLVATGVTPGTYNSVTVDQFGRVTGGTTIASNAIVEPMENATASTIPPGRAVYSSGPSEVSLAIANNIATSKFIGFAGASIGAGTVGPIVIGGIIELTEGQWDAVTSQSGGLTPNSEYYLSNVTAGSITTSAPTSGVHAPVGIAISSTKLKIDPKRVVIL